SPSALHAAKNEAHGVERQLVAVEVAPRACDVEADRVEHRNQLVRRIHAQRVAKRAAAAVGANERPVGAAAAVVEVELAAFDHQRAGLELLPVQLLKAAREREQVDGVDEERATGAKRSRDALDEALVLRLLVEVAERAREEVDRGVELAVEVELARIALEERRAEAFALRSLPRERDCPRAEVDAGDVEPASRQLEAVASVATCDVQHTR